MTPGKAEGGAEVEIRGTEIGRQLEEGRLPIRRPRIFFPVQLLCQSKSRVDALDSSFHIPMLPLKAWIGRKGQRSGPSTNTDEAVMGRRLTHHRRGRVVVFNMPNVLEHSLKNAEAVECIFQFAMLLKESFPSHSAES